MNESTTYTMGGGEVKREKVMSDGAIKVNTSRAFSCPGTDKTFGLQLRASGFNDVECDS